MRKDDPDFSEDYKAYQICLVDKIGHRRSPVIVRSFEPCAPEIFAFRDVDGRHYVYIEGYESTIRSNGAICLVKVGKLYKKWSGLSRYSLFLYATTAWRRAYSRVESRSLHV